MDIFTLVLFNIIMEVAVMSARASYGQQIFARDVRNSTLHLSHSLGGCAKNDQTKNEPGSSPSHVIITEQSNACSQQLPGYPWVKPG